MITPRLEKAILAGWANFKVLNHAFGSFGSVTIPKDNLVIITHVKWNHFFNTYRTENFNQTSLQDLYRYSEYQLKIDGFKSKNFLIFKNQMEFKIMDPTLKIDVTAPISSYIDNFKKYFFPQHPQPIIQDVFFVCEDYIKLTISRNEYINNINTDFTTLNPKVNEDVLPTGVGNVNVLKNAEMNSIGGSKMTYSPPNRINAQPSSFNNPQTMETYSQPYDKNSFMANIKGNSDIQYFTNPLVELGIVTFNKNYFDQIMND